MSVLKADNIKSLLKIESIYSTLYLFGSLSLWFCISLQCIKGVQRWGGLAWNQYCSNLSHSKCQIFTGFHFYGLHWSTNQVAIDLPPFQNYFIKEALEVFLIWYSNMSFCTLFWKDNKPSTQLLGAVMSSCVWKIIKRVQYVFPCNGPSVPKQSGGGLKRKLFNSASSAAAMLWVYIPPLDCLTSCDKGDSRCS